MNGSFQPVFVKNSPGIICDQLLYLVKNSNLNFELHETPFSLNLNLKKSFTHQWNKTHHASHHATDPVHHQPHHPSVGQPAQLSPDPSNQTQNHSFSQLHVPQPLQPHQIPQQVPDLVHQPYPVDPPTTQTGLKLIKDIDSIKAEHKETLKDYAELDKAHRKLVKEHKDLEAKHSKVCSAMKSLKKDNEELAKEGNALSVAIKGGMKDSEISKRKSEKDIESLKAELANLKEYKIQQEEEARKAKRLDKKMRQKEKKKASQAENKDLDNSGVETTKIVPVENCAESEEQVKPFAKQMSESFKDEKLTDLRSDTFEETEDCENNLEYEEKKLLFINQIMYLLMII